MDRLNEKEFRMIEEYKKTKNVEIATYFFNKFEPDLTRLIYSKINRKFSSIPFEKGDIFSFIWKGVKTTLEQYKGDKGFNQILINNCYISTLKEAKKFITNGQLILNQSFSFENYVESNIKLIDKNNISYISDDSRILLKNLIDDACNYVKNYKPNFVKQVIYLKSIGCSVSEVCKKLNVSRYYVEDLLKNIEEMMRKSYKL